MLIARVNKPLSYKMDNQVVNLEAGKSYVFNYRMFDRTRALAEPDTFGELLSLEGSYRKYSGQELAGKSLFVWRTGGIGDILFMTPALKYIKTQWPDVRITLATKLQYHSLFTNHPLFDKVIDMPFTTELLDENDFHLHFESVIEENPKATQVNAYDLFVEEFGLRMKIPPRPPEMLPVVGLDEHKNADARAQVDKMAPGKTRIGLHVATSSPMRNWPLDQQMEFCHQATAAGYSVFLYGSKSNMPLTVQMEEIPGVYNLIPYTGRDLSLTVVYVNNMDILVGADSALVHIAGALRIPVVGLYGPFHPQLRMKYFVNATGMDGLRRCQSRLGLFHCYAHGMEPCKFAGPTGESPCVRMIDVQDNPKEKHKSRVLEQVEILLKKTGKL